MNWPEIAILLLPVASLSGYLLGRRGGEKSSGQRVDLLSKQYFQGLNHLLNEEQDQAIALFERIADDDTDRFETQLALGSLFRRRGELERAIRLHQDLSVRAMLTTEQRSIALLELGDDFVRAGLLDRAEALFDELLAIDAQSAPALKQLIGIYEQEREWPKAARAASEFERLTLEPMGKLISHFHCEAALAAIVPLDATLGEMETSKSARVDAYKAFDASLALAKLADPDSVRVALMQAERAIELNNVQIAQAALCHVVETDVLFIPETLPILAKLRAISASSADALLDQFSLIERGSNALLARALTLPEPEAAALLHQRLKLKPSARVLARWLKLRPCPSNQSGNDEGIGDLSFMFDSLTQATGSTLSHRCSQCGFGMLQQHWQCPSCKGWGTIKPLVAI
jgi:lipopolysaccharide biosynthesis regulator YciM